MCLLVNNYCCNQKSALTTLFPQSHRTLPSTGLTDPNILLQSACPSDSAKGCSLAPFQVSLAYEEIPSHQEMQRHFTRSPSRCFEEPADVLQTAVRVGCGRVRGSATQTQLKTSPCQRALCTSLAHASRSGQGFAGRVSDSPGVGVLLKLS